jgi:hypothetical protein
MTGGDTVWIHAGLYPGDFNCCGNGDATIEMPEGSGDVNSTSRFHDIPAGTLSAGRYYYVRLRVGETNDWMKSGGDAMASNGGWGTWSVGFYRFVVGAGALEPPKNLRIVE